MTSQASAADIVQDTRATATAVTVALSCDGIQISLDDILLDEIALLIDHEFHGKESATQRLSAAMILLTDITVATQFTNRRYGILEGRTRRDWVRATAGFDLDDLEGFGVLPSELGGAWLPATMRMVTRLTDGTRVEEWVPYLQYHSAQDITRAVQNDLEIMAQADLRPNLAQHAEPVKRTITQEQIDRLFADLADAGAGGIAQAEESGRIAPVINENRRGRGRLGIRLPWAR